jgi:hypothetical protein
MLSAVSPWNSPPFLLIYSLPWQNIFDNCVMVNMSFLQPQLPTQLFHLAFFVSSWRGTWTCNPQLPFLFFGFFLFLSIYFYPYLFQGPRLDFWEPLFLYLNYLSAKIKLFGQTSFSILQLKIETWHDPV